MLSIRCRTLVAAYVLSGPLLRFNQVEYIVQYYLKKLSLLLNNGIVCKFVLQFCQLYYIFKKRHLSFDVS